MTPDEILQHILGTIPKVSGLPYPQGETLMFRPQPDNLRESTNVEDRRGQYSRTGQFATMPPPDKMQGSLQEWEDYMKPASPATEGGASQFSGVNVPVVAQGSGAQLQVDRDYAPQFQALIDDLEAAGVHIDPAQSGGFNRRNIAGTNKPSNHSYGAAIDLNWSQNPRGGMGAISSQVPPETIRQIAARHGMTWGGDWRNPDPMHFEIAGGPRLG